MRWEVYWVVAFSRFRFRFSWDVRAFYTYLSFACLLSRTFSLTPIERVEFLRKELEFQERQRKKGRGKSCASLPFIAPRQKNVRYSLIPYHEIRLGIPNS